MSLAKDKPYYKQPSDYEDDVYLWAFEQAQLLRLGRFHEADLPNIIEELESFGREMRTKLSIAYRDLLSYLLEWQYSSEARAKGLDLAILNARIAIQSEEEDNKSLRDDARRIVTDDYPQAVRLAMVATGLAREAFPIECPYSVDFLRDMDAMPDERRDE